jgi:hypothetical protein
LRKWTIRVSKGHEMTELGEVDRGLDERQEGLDLTQTGLPTLPETEMEVRSGELPGENSGLARSGNE